MSELKICRICLRTEAKMFKMNVFDLQLYYREVTAFKIDDNDRLPNYFCYECATLLHKFHSFKEKCYTGQKVLKDMLLMGPITYEDIYKVDRKKLNLMSSLNMIQNDKVGTIFILNDKNFIQKNEGKQNPMANHKLEVLLKEKLKKEMDIEHALVDEAKLFCETEVYIKTENNLDFIEEVSSVEGCKTDNDPIHDDSEDVSNKSIATEKPMNVFIVADRNKDVAVKKLKAKQLRESKYNRITKSKPNKKVAWKLKKILKEGNWKNTTMSEEETLQNFRTKAQCEKYINAKYKCPDCYMSFSNNEIYARHRLRWHTELNNPFECRFCKMRFRLNFQIKNHLKSHYNKFECLRCKLICSRESTLLAHDDYHKGKIKTCEHCNEEFRHQSTYYTHIRTAHRSKYLCNLCGCSFVNEVGMRLHKLRKHLETELTENKETSDANRDMKTYCSLCDINFETEEAFNKHMLHSSKHIDDLTPDRKVRSRRLPTECPQCGKQFKSQGACLKHHKSEHPNHRFNPYPELDRKHICELCGTVVLYKNLNSHLINTHEKRNACHCSTCGKKFSAESALKLHRVVHTGEKPYKCTLCDKRFTQNGSMKLHYRTFHLKEPYPKRIRKTKAYDLQDKIEMRNSE